MSLRQCEHEAELSDTCFVPSARLQETDESELPSSRWDPFPNSQRRSVPNFCNLSDQSNVRPEFLHLSKQEEGQLIFLNIVLHRHLNLLLDTLAPKNKKPSSPF